MFRIPLLLMVIVLASCTPMQPDNRPFRVRVAEDVLKRKEMFSIEDARILEAAGQPGSYCVYIRKKSYFIYNYIVGLYFPGQSLNGISTMTAVFPSGLGSGVALMIRCPFPVEDYKPFPEYEAMKK